MAKHIFPNTGESIPETVLPGRGSMRERVRMLLSFGVGLCVLISCSIPGFAGAAHPNGMDAERFGELPWGVTVEKAIAAFPDLAFVKYAITDEKEAPSTGYERKNEERKISGVRVDEILYWFRNDSLYKVTATLGSKVGPRTLETAAAEAFDRLLDAISRVAGPPVENRTQRGTWNGNRKGVWQHGGMSIALTCIEPPGVNGEELVLEIVRRAVSKGRAPE
jgi:hypothetical protein